MTVWLSHQGHAVNRKRVQRLMRLMGLEAIYPKPKLSAANKETPQIPASAAGCGGGSGESGVGHRHLYPKIKTG